MKRNYFVCCLIALLGSLNMQAFDFEVDGIYYTVTGKDSVSVVAGTNLYGGSVTIPATVKNDTLEYKVAAIDSKAFYYCTDLTSVIIPEGVEKIDYAAFRNCSGLTSVALPASIKKMGNAVFFGCSSLASVTLPDNLTAIEPYTFFACKNLTTVSVPASVRRIGGSAFGDCKALTSVNIPVGITEIASHTFENCSALTSVVIPVGVTDIGDYAFQNCSALTSVVIPAGVTQLGRCAFFGCNLASVTIPATVKLLVSSTFGSCPNLSTISVESGNTKYSAEGNALIETIVDDKTSDITKRLVMGCASTVIPDGVTEIGRCAFENCNGLTSITIPASVTSIEDYAFSSCTDLTSVTILEGLTDIGNYAFAGCENLESISLPASTATIGDEAFAQCSGLKVVTCNAIKCPKASSDAFLSISEDAVLFVPSASYDEYARTDPWKQFLNIDVIENNMVAEERDAETAITSLEGFGKIQQVYQLGGQQTSRLQRGINIVRMSDGTTRKVLVK
ncbi:MAG: leucine-rich repeat domain-containing protein [Bacteroidaceae bacterium]|nr:leucine-rich repeat domain-containing protein [Bacteroidaceae bacterium]